MINFSQLFLAWRPTCVWFPLEIKSPFPRYRYVTLLVKNHYVFNCSHDTGRVISRFGVAFTRNRINVGFEFVCFSYLKFEPLLLTIFTACHEDVRFPATQLVVLVLTVMKHLRLGVHTVVWRLNFTTVSNFYGTYTVFKLLRLALRFHTIS